jgi:hypothetical protein
MVGQVIVSAIATIGFVGILTLWALHPPTAQGEMLNVLVGALATGYITVVNYWLGSSSGSRSKDKLLQSKDEQTTPANDQINKL